MGRALEGQAGHQAGRVHRLVEAEGEHDRLVVAAAPPVPLGVEQLHDRRGEREGLARGEGAPASGHGGRRDRHLVPGPVSDLARIRREDQGRRSRPAEPAGQGRGDAHERGLHALGDPSQGDHRLGEDDPDLVGLLDGVQAALGPHADHARGVLGGGGQAPERAQEDEDGGSHDCWNPSLVKGASLSPVTPGARALPGGIPAFRAGPDLRARFRAATAVGALTRGRRAAVVAVHWPFAWCAEEARGGDKQGTGGCSRRVQRSS